MWLLYWILILALVAAVVVGGVWFYSTQMGGGGGSSGIFGGRPEKRLGVIEHSNVDGRRKLVLIRRDDVEHLIMTGGPVDVVIETNINDHSQVAAAKGDAAGSAVFSRSPRSFGNAVGE